MYKRPLIELASLLFLFSVIFVITLFSLFDDGLFFHSDLRSVFVLSSALGLCLSVILALAGAAWIRHDRARARMKLALVLSIASLVVSALTLFSFDFLQREFQIFGFLKGGHADLLVVALWAASVVLVGVRLARHRDRDGVFRRVTTLALVLAPVSVLSLFGLIAEAHVSGRGRPASGTPRHVVMIVLDAWPAHYLHTFNPAAPIRPIDALFESALVFRNMHTNAVWTHGYFGVLYWGTAAFTHRSQTKFHHRFTRGERGEFPAWNLLSALQRLGVKTRWITFHQAGIPESRAVSSYTGFRSVHLTHRYAWLLRALGLDYNLVMASPAVKNMVRSPRRAALFGLLNSPEKLEDSLHEVLVPELKALQKRTERSFLLFHTGWTAGRVSLPAAWEESAPKSTRERLAAEIKARNNRYLPTEEWYAEELREKAAHYTDSVGEKLEGMFAELQAENLLANTLVILTADHGHMFDRGRFWYGFHPDEEVARVGLIVFNGGRKGIEDGKHETIDIPQTLIDYFGGTESLQPRAFSLLRSGDKEFTATVTLRSAIHREWFVVVYANGRKYVFNVDPKSAGESIEMSVDGYDSTVIASGPEVVDRVRLYLKQALLDLGLPYKDIHPRYQALLSGGS